MLVAVTELVHTLLAVTGLLDNSKNIERKNLELSLSKLSILLIKCIVCPYLRYLSFHQNPPYAENM